MPEIVYVDREGQDEDDRGWVRGGCDSNRGHDSSSQRVGEKKGTGERWTGDIEY